MNKKELTAAMFAKMDELRQKVQKLFATFEDYTTEQGTTLIVDGDIAVDKEAKVVDGDGNEVPAPNGEYKLSVDGRVVIVVDGKITEVKNAAPAVEEMEMSDIESVDELFNGIYDLMWKLSERYATMQSQLGVILDAQKGDGAVILQMQEDAKQMRKDIETIGKAPAAPTRTPRKPEPKPVEMGAEEKLTATQRLAIKQRERIAALNGE